MWAQIALSIALLLGRVFIPWPLVHSSVILVLGIALARLAWAS